MKISKKFTLIILSFFTAAQFQFTVQASIVNESAANKAKTFITNIAAEFSNGIARQSNKAQKFIKNIKISKETKRIVAWTAGIAVLVTIVTLITLVRLANPPYEPKGPIYGKEGGAHNKNNTDDYKGQYYQMPKNLDKKLDDPKKVYIKNGPNTQDIAQETINNLLKAKKKECELEKIVNQEVVYPNIPQNNEQLSETGSETENEIKIELELDEDIEQAISQNKNKEKNEKEQNEKEQKELLEKLGTTKEEQENLFAQIKKEQNTEFNI